MKKLLPILFMTALVVSCYEEIIIPVGDDEPVVVMNAQLNTGDTTHAIYLFLSQKNRVTLLNRADVRVTINGKATLTAREIYDDHANIQLHYGFDAELKPGDEVQIEARKDAFYVTATVIAPPAIDLTLIDTSTVRMSYMGETDEFLQVKLGFRDLPGDTWYRVDACLETEYAYMEEDGSPSPEYSGNSIWWISPETGFDPIVSEGGGKTGGMDFAALLSVEDSYNCFSDNAFRDKECTIRPLFYPYSVYGYYERYTFPVLDDYTQYENVYEIISKMPYYSHRKARLQVRTIDFTQYHYLKALQNLDTYGTEMTFLVEPTTLPSNVEGGLGFVGLETVSEVVFYEKEETLPPSGSLLYY